jgi:hypothetical protein
MTKVYNEMNDKIVCDFMVYYLWIYVKYFCYFSKLFLSLLNVIIDIFEKVIN